MLEIKASLCCKGSAPAQVGVLPNSVFRLHKGFQFAANSIMFLIGDFVALFIGISIGGLTGLGWGGYFVPMTIASATILFGANAIIVAFTLRKGGFQKYSRRQFMVLSAIVYLTCLAFIIGDVSKGLLKLP